MKLDAENIGRRAGDHWLLRNITLSVGPGQRISVVGKSGSGKTLLLRALALLDPITSGQIRWGQKSLVHNAIPYYRSKVIYLQQQPALMEGTVESNLRVPYSLKVHREKRFDRDAVIESLKALDRDESFLQKEKSDLSGGELQLTAILRSIQLDPNILLLDEPTAALDTGTTKTFESLVNHWLFAKPQERAFLWVTHDPDQATRVSTSVFQIRDGMIQEESEIG